MDKNQVGVVGDINKIYRATHEPEGLDGWWATKTDGTPKVGQVLDLHFLNIWGQSKNWFPTRDFTLTPIVADPNCCEILH